MSNPFADDNDPKAQGSKAWKEARKEGIGGSQIAVILGLSPYMTPYQLWLEMTGLVEPEDIGNMPHVMRGTLAEPIARKKLEDHLGFKLLPKVYDQRGVARYSSDGTNQEMGVFCEIKAMGLEAHNAVMEDKIPEHYMPQIIWGFGIDPKMRDCYFVSVRPENDHKLHIKLVERTPEIDAKFAIYYQKAVEFMEFVRTKTPPALTDKDCVTNESEIFNADVAAWLEAKEAAKEAERVLEIREEALKSYLTGMAGSVENDKARITRFSRRGPIKYDQIPEIRALPQERLEAFRGPTSVSVRITPKKEK